MREPQTENAASTASAAGADWKLDAAERARVVAGVVANVKQHYVERDLAQKMADALAAHEKRGDYSGAKDGAALASLLTKQLRSVSPDRHLEVVYSEVPLPKLAAGPTPEEDARFREAMQRENCTFEKVEILANNVGYLKLNAFPARSVCEGTAAAAMKRMNDANAVIFDLRDNRGGEPETVQFLAAYLFDHPEYWYNPRENTTRQSWTRSPVPGNLLADKPVYVLTSGRTASGAEQFCYDLKMLKRVTIVGERTGGTAHAGVWHRIDDHFGMGIPETKAINPYAEADWAEVGVEPDVKVSAAEALKVAQELAAKGLRQR